MSVIERTAWGEPSAEMRETMAADAKLREGKPVPKDIVEERTLRAGICDYWIDGAPVMHHTTDISVDGKAGAVRARVYRPTSAENAPIMLLIHGGGWAFGSIEETEPLARHLAAKSGAVIVSTSYRLAPEHPFPAGLHDCEATLQWIRENGKAHGGDPSRLSVGGNSAGGNLAAAVALRAPGTFKAALLFYGVLGNSLDTPSYLHFGDGRFGLSRNRMKMFFDIYVPKGADVNDIAITPMNGDLSKMPPSWVCAAECDVLHDDSVLFFDKLKSIRSGDQFILAKGVNHGFINRMRHLPRASEMIDSAAAFLKANV
jgi:acetyl esterase